MPTPPPRRAALAAALALTAVTALSACGSDTLDVGESNAVSGGGAAATAAAQAAVDKITPDPKLKAMLPAKVQSSGVINVGAEAAYAPMEFVGSDGSSIIGVDVDLFGAIAKKMGVKAQFQQTEFAAIIMGVTGGKYDAGVSSFTINKDREKQVLMTSYFKAGTLWAVQKGNPKKVDLNNVCGLSIGVQKGTVQVDDLTARSKKCTQAGKPAINQVVEAGQSKVTADLVSGKVVAFAADSPVTAYAVTLQGDFIERLGDMYASAPYGTVVRKSEPQFAQVIGQALDALKKDGTYAAILKKWNVDDGAIDTFEVNPEVAE